MSLQGTIFKVGLSPSGVYYPEEVLQDMVNKFNEKYKLASPVGQLSTIYPPTQLNPESISHTINSLSFDDVEGKVTVDITFIDNDKGKHLVNLFKNVSEKVSIHPIVCGDVTDDGVATILELSRVDFHYNYLTNNQSED